MGNTPNGSVERAGGLGAWAPSHVPPRGHDLTPAQELACALRHLDDTGFCENLSGHITWQLPGDDHLLANPWGYWWAEVRGRDLLRLDIDGRVTEGQWDVTPAIHIHTELHRARPDARVVVHSHPPYASVLAAIGELPGIVHQNSSILADEMVLVVDYDGEVDSPVLGQELAARIGPASVALLVSHGVIVTAPTMAEAVYKSVLFERTCWMHHQIRLVGRLAHDIAPAFQRQLKASLVERAASVYWDGAVRQLLAREPEVLD
ncbi:MAG: class II aldolase/adducin family protein [Acidimicrobiia bacterium]|nr:class II aldolase/adducin family protein [Acidimicrobiia bacterium]